MTVIHVAHEGGDYDVLIGELSDALPRLQAAAAGLRLPVISDDRVYGLHGAKLADVGLSDPVLIPEGEQAKDWHTLAAIIDELAGLGITRGTPIVALGGGSVGDVAGLATSLYKRGCPIIHIPTTLLAQADSAIGGKTAIDAAGRKNFAGTFHHPALVIADPALLDTLDSRQLRAGYAEVIKYGLIDDSAFFGWCETNGRRVLEGDHAARRAAVEHCVRAKARFVTADPHDTMGTRALLNLGHTFGHAIEAVAGPAVPHGEAVAVGMALAFRFSTELGLCPAAHAVRVLAHLQAVRLPTALDDVGVASDKVFEAMLADKKATAKGLTLILVRGIGAAFVAQQADLEALSKFLANHA